VVCSQWSVVRILVVSLLFACCSASRPNGLSRDARDKRLLPRIRFANANSVRFSRYAGRTNLDVVAPSGKARSSVTAYGNIGRVKGSLLCAALSTNNLQNMTGFSADGVNYTRARTRARGAVKTRGFLVQRWVPLRRRRVAANRRRFPPIVRHCAALSRCDLVDRARRIIADVQLVASILSERCRLLQIEPAYLRRE